MDAAGKRQLEGKVVRWQALSAGQHNFFLKKTVYSCCQNANIHLC